MFLFLLLPLLVRWLVPPANDNHEAALRVPQLQDFTVPQDFASNNAANRSQIYLALFLWVLLVAAGARPQWVNQNESLLINTRNIMLAVDVSGSMKRNDFMLESNLASRLQAAKAVVGSFVDRRKGDRIGLIVFGSRAYQYVPLTFDTVTLKKMLYDTSVGVAGINTTVGDAIGLGVKLLKDQKSGSKVLILMTDGQHNVGKLSPLEAAGIASRAGLKIYTVGIGPSDRSQYSDPFRFSYRPRRSNLNETNLIRIAQMTGGQFFRASNTNELDTIYKVLDQLEPVQSEDNRFRPKTELYHWFLGVFVAILFVYLGFRQISRRLD